MGVTFTADGPLGFITLDKPPANSYDLEFMTEFSEAVDQAVVGATRVVIVQSASEKFFSAGADIKKFLEGDVGENMEMIKVSQSAFRRMAAAPQVFIAYIAGHALGGGLEIALACDIRLGSAGLYKLGLPEVTLGLLPGNGGTQRLTRLIGPSRALELLVTGRTYTVEEAREMGLVADVYNTDEGRGQGPRVRIAARRRRRTRDRGDQTLRARGRRAVALQRARARGRAHGAAVQVQGRRRGTARVRREAQAGVRGRMSTLTTHPGSFIAGAEHRNAGDPLEVVNPADGRAFTEVATATEADVDAAVEAAADAQKAWSELAVSKRGEILGRAAHHVEEHIDELIPLLTREQGKTLRDSKIEITKAVDTLLHYVGLSKSLRGVHTPNLDPGVDGMVLRRPLGVVGAIVPWNFPTTLLCNKLAPALVAGNTVVAKPAATTPLTTLRFAELLAEGGLPDGVFNVITGRGSEAGRGARHAPADVRKIAFTGLDPGWRADHGPVRARHQARDARAGRL